MRSFDEAYAAATDRTAFPNGTSWEIWSSTWSHQSRHDVLGTGSEGDQYALIMVGFLGRTPAEWHTRTDDDGSDWYHCAEFEPAVDDSDNSSTEGEQTQTASPSEPIPGQLDLFSGACAGCRCGVACCHEPSPPDLPHDVMPAGRLAQGWSW